MIDTADQNAPALILLVDDSEEMRTQLKHYLRSDGYRFVEAANGKDALSLFEQHKPDLVVLDVAMPVMDGIETCTRLRLLPDGGKVPVLMLTAMDDQQYIDNAFDAGADEYINKPVHWAVLRHRIKYLLEVSRGQERLAAIENLQILNRIVEACTSTLNLNEILQITLDEAIAIAGLEGGTICLLGADETLHLVAHGGASDETIEDLTTHEIKVGDCLCGNCARDMKPLILWNREEVLNYSSREAQRGEDIRFHASFAFVYKGKCVGVLCVFTRTDDKPDEKSLKLLETMSGQVALAIENARLYEETVKNALTLENKVTERSAELRESENKFRQIADTINDIIWMTAPDGSEIIYISPGFEKLWGVSSEALYKDSTLWMKPIVSEDRRHVQEMFTYDRLTRGEFDVEFRIRNAKGTVSWIHAVGYPVLDDKGEVYRISGIASDITKFKEIDQLKSMFIASMSHELRTPLNSIIGFTGMTLQGLSGDLNDEQKDNLSRVYRSGKHLLVLIADVIDISKIEAGRIDTFPTEFSFEELVNEAIETVRPQIKEKGLAIEANNIPDLTMHTDRRRLLQCFLNILSNAVKYTENGKITVTSQTVNSDVEFAVSDTGIGIEDSDMPRLFEAFERMNTKLRVKAGGTGLGLYLTKKIVHELLRGSIAVQSHAGRGSTFTIRVPKDLQQEEKSHKQSIEVS